MVRSRIESLCLDRTIANGDVTWGANLVAAMHRLLRTPQREPPDQLRMNETWSAAHDAYHEALVSACDSPWLLRLRRLLYAQSERYRRLSVPLSESARDIDREHQDLVDSVLGRDVRRAQLLMRQHLDRTTQVLLRQSWASAA